MTDEGDVYRGSHAWIVCLGPADYRSGLRFARPALLPLARGIVEWVSTRRHRLSRALGMMSDQGALAVSAGACDDGGCTREDAMKVAIAGGGLRGPPCRGGAAARARVASLAGRRGVPWGGARRLRPRSRSTAGALRCDAIVNLAGIKREDGRRPSRPCVEATRRLPPVRRPAPGASSI